MALTHAERSRHLDIGCGGKPRNPYRCVSVSACDLAFTGAVPAGIQFRAVDLSAQSIPFPDQHFASVSAFDFL